MLLGLLVLLAAAPTWVDVPGPTGARCGRSTQVALSTAAFPGEARGGSVYVFVPEGYRDRGPVDLTLHYHGWHTHVADSMGLHGYAAHTWASGANTVLVMPQGPWNAPSSDFGQLLAPEGARALIEDVARLVRARVRTTDASAAAAGGPLVGDVTVTAHSGGYVPATAALAPGVPGVRMVGFLDALYGSHAELVAFAARGGLVRVVGTLTAKHNDALLGRLGRDAATRAHPRSLRDAGAVVWRGRGDHYGVTWSDDTYAELLRWGARHSRAGPRVELREARCEGAVATVRWMAPLDEDVEAWTVQTWTRARPAAWETVATVDAASTSASFRCAEPVRVRVRPRVRGVAEPLASDIYALAPDPGVLVVDGIDRVVRAPSPGLAHDLAARVGEAARAVATVTDEAVTEREVDLTRWNAVVWLTGPDSAEEGTLDDSAQALLRAYVEGGGKLVVSGAGVAHDLGGTDGVPRADKSRPILKPGAHGAAFLADVFSARYRAPQRTARHVRAEGKRYTILARGGGYAAPAMHSLKALNGGHAFAVWADGRAVGVGQRGRTLLLGVPVELVDGTAARAQLLARALKFVKAG